MIQTDKERSVVLGEYMVCHRATVRATAKEFGISKSTVHKDLQQRLKELNLAKWHKVMAVLDCNFTQRHLRGGMATQQK